MRPLTVVANEFQLWQRVNLPRELVIQDIDAWTLAISNVDPYEPTAILELKRGTAPVPDWRLSSDNRAQYAAGLRLAQRAGIPYFVLYFRKGVEIEDDTPLQLVRLTAADPDFHGTRRVLTAGAFRDEFPAVLDHPGDARW